MHFHGEFFEPQMTLFANKNYKEDFAKFYFGNLGNIKTKDQEGFMVIEYLDKNSRHNLHDKNYPYFAPDALYGENMINNIIYDFGGVQPLDKRGYRISSHTL